MDRGASLTIAVYFAFTSLSTVGFGDYHPRGDIERVVGAFLLLFGVAIFSYCLSIFKEILREIRDFNAGLDDGENLSRFFGILRQYNGRQIINIEFQHKITAYFEYRWKNDRIVAFQLQEDLDVVDQLPREVQCSIFVDFLYKDFLE
jgi:hypothetical protein